MTIYLVWAYYQYYPTGPDDLQGIFLTLEEAQEYFNQLEGYDYKRIQEREV